MGMNNQLAKRWVLLVISSAQREGATDLILGPGADGGTAARYKVADAWHDYSPSEVTWSSVGSELGGLAGIRDKAFPKQGIIYVAYSGVRLRWQLEMMSADGQCLLHNLGNEMV